MTVTTYPSILDGTGRVTCGAFDGAGRWYSGSDTAGVHRSTDDDQGFEAFQAGLHLRGGTLSNVFQHCAGIGASTDTVVHVNGHLGSGGSIQTRLPGDTEWRIEPRYFGDGSNKTSGGGAARPTGRRVAVAAEWVWVSCQDSAGGNKYGLVRSSDYGVTWSAWKFADDREYTALALSPQFDTPGARVLYGSADNAGAGAAGLYVITHADGTAVFTRIDNTGSGAPTFTSPRDVAVVAEGGADVAYVVGSAGIHRCVVGDPTAGGWSAGSVAWTSITPPGTTSSDWNSIVAERSGSVTRLIAGNFNAATNATGTYTRGNGVIDSGNGTGQYRATHMRSLDGGASWAAISGAANVSPVVYGTAEVWVQATAKHTSLNASRLGGDSHSVGQLVLDQDNDMVMSFGKGGVWRCDDPWATVPHWQPFVAGLGGINVEAVVMDPLDNTHIANTDTDRHGYHFVNGGLGQPRCYFDSIPKSSFAIWYRPVAAGNPNGTTLVGNAANVSVNTDPWNPSANYTTHAAGATVDDVCRFGYGGDVITLVLCGGTIKRSTAADLSGLTSVATGVGSPGVGGQSFCAQEGDPNVYLFTLTGWWRSTDAGAHWSKVSTHSASGANDAQAKCAQDGAHPTTLYYTLTEAHPGLWKVADADGAFTVSQVTGGTLSAGDRCGPVAVDPTTGDVAVVVTADDPGGADLLVAPYGSTAFASVADANFAEYCDYPFNMAMVGDRIVVGQSGHGMIMLDRTAGPPPADPPANTVLPVITGTAQDGHALSVSSGSWSGSPTGYTHQWRRCATDGTGCADIPGATGSTYLLGPADVGSTIRAVVTATNGVGSTPATAVQSATVVAAGTPPGPPPPVPSGVWTPETTPYDNDTSQPLTFTADGFLAMAVAGYVVEIDGSPTYHMMVSDDAGDTWTGVATVIDGAGNFVSCLSASGAGYLAVGVTMTADYVTYSSYVLRAAVDAPGVWTEVLIAEASGGAGSPQLTALDFVDGSFLLAGTDTAGDSFVFTSPDAVTWSALTPVPEAGQPTGFAGDGSKIVAAGYFPAAGVTAYTVYVSLDGGASWTGHGPTTNIGNLNHVRYANGVWRGARLAFSGGGPMLFTSADGDDWIPAAVDPFDGIGFDGSLVYDISYEGGFWWASGRNLVSGEALLAKSADGDTWALDTTPYTGLSFMLAVRAGTGVLVGVGGNLVPM